MRICTSWGGRHLQGRRRSSYLVGLPTFARGGRCQRGRGPGLGGGEASPGRQLMCRGHRDNPRTTPDPTANLMIWITTSRDRSRGDGRPQRYLQFHLSQHSTHPYPYPPCWGPPGPPTDENQLLVGPCPQVGDRIWSGSSWTPGPPGRCQGDRLLQHQLLLVDIPWAGHTTSYS